MEVRRLLVDGRDVDALLVAQGPWERRRGLLGRDGLEGGLLLERARSVHSVGMRFDLDVAFVDRGGVVVAVQRLRRHRLSRTVWRSRAVLEAQAGAFRRWGLQAGSVVTWDLS